VYEKFVDELEVEITKEHLIHLSKETEMTKKKELRDTIKNLSSTTCLKDKENISKTINESTLNYSKLQTKKFLKCLTNTERKNADVKTLDVFGISLEYYSIISGNKYIQCEKKITSFFILPNDKNRQHLKNSYL
jgi:hypothetical protein